MAGTQTTRTALADDRRPAFPAGRSIGRRRTLPGSRAVVGGFLVAAAAVGLFAASRAANRGNDTTFVVASHDLVAGRTVGAGDVTLAVMDLPGPTGARAYRRVSVVIGSLLVGAISRGEVIQASSLLPASGPPPFREITVQVDAAQARAVVERDTVDVLVTTGTNEASRTEVVVGGARILRIGSGAQSLSSDGRPSVTFALQTFDEVNRVVEASHVGSLTLVRANGFAPQVATFTGTTSRPPTGGP